MTNGLEIDNAFFTGEYFSFGKGVKMFYDMATIDVAGHEFGHAMVQRYAQLIYQDEPGAINEGICDGIAVAFEHYIYNKNKDLIGVPDFYIGEDQARTMPWLRNTRNPNDAKYPQPKTYKGKHWYTGKGDHGGVHTNSGVIGHLFQRMVGGGYKDMKQGCAWWLDMLVQLNATSNMKMVSNMLLKVSDSSVICQNALIDVGLLEEKEKEKEEEKEEPNNRKIEVIYLPKSDQKYALIREDDLNFLFENQKKTQ